MQTGDNNLLLRRWYEVSIKKSSFNCLSRNEALKTQVKWFSSLVSKKDNLKPLLSHLKKVKATNQITEMKHGNKVSRILFWTFKE